MQNLIVPPPVAVPLSIDRTDARSLSEQIRAGIAEAILRGVIEPGARLPSWHDLAAQLGVARGTVRRAYTALATSSSPSLRRRGHPGGGAAQAERAA